MNHVSGFMPGCFQSDVKASFKSCSSYRTTALFNLGSERIRKVEACVPSRELMEDVCTVDVHISVGQLSLSKVRFSYTDWPDNNKRLRRTTCKAVT